MFRRVRFNLKTVGLWLFCISIGLTASGSWAQLNFDNLGDLAESIPYLMHYVLLVACAIAMSIGLLQQAKRLRNVQCPTHELRLALQQAVGWRICVSMALCISVALLISLIRGVIHFPEWFGEPVIYSTRVIPEFLLYAAMIAVLIQTLGEATSIARSSVLRWISYTAVSVFGLAALIHGVLSHYLTYRTLSESEADHAVLFRRPGAYPDFEAEGYWLFWQSAAAMAAQVCGALILLALLRGRWRSGNSRAWVMGLGIVLQAASAAFGYWFLLVGLPAIAPDFAEGGWAVTNWRCIEATVVLAISIPTFAYRLIYKQFPTIQVIESPRGSPSFHLEPITVILLAMSATFFAVSWVQGVVAWANSTWSDLSPLEAIFWMVLDVSGFMPIAVSILSVLLAFKYLTGGELSHPTYLRPVPWSQLSLASVVLLLILASSMPTIFAFCFAWWTGPWSSY